MSQRSMIVSLIGRPNVGKSTIFNRLMGNSKLSLTHDLPGVTRDRHYGVMKFDEEKSCDIILVDTGGFYPTPIHINDTKKNNVDPFFNLMIDHAKLAIDESDLVMFVVDVREGLIPFDQEICSYIQSTKKPVWLLMNKFDSEKQDGAQFDFYELGLDEEVMFRISAEHNRGLIRLKEHLYTKFQSFVATQLKIQDEFLSKGITPHHDVVGSVAIVGAPNAGKSTLLNSLIGVDRALVSDIAGTTVDPIEGYLSFFFGEDSEDLTTKENAFRKTDKDLLDEFSGLNNSLEDLSNEEDAVYLEYGKTNPYEVFEEEEQSEQEELQVPQDIPEEDFYTLKDLEASLIPKNEEVTQEEVLTFEKVGWRSLKLVDTAGIRKSKLVEGFIETQSVYRSLRAISESDIVIFMVDATIGITHQDRRLCDIALEKGKSIIICLNKIDLLKDIFTDAKKKKVWLEDMRRVIPWLSFCQLITISAKLKNNINYLREAIKRTILIRHRKVPTGALNRVVTQLVDRHPIMISGKKARPFKVKYASMLKSSPPTFLLFSNRSLGIPENYRKYLTNGIRREFNLINSPVHLIFRTTSDMERRLKKVTK